ncbi:MAG: lipoprotein [Treponema sp.]|jgi:ABC-type glycerol-3-phosphate transport system substrate-binding protein|nr:lipoprotein [Treponema sp.]
MKKMFILGIVAIAISLGLASCGQKGGTLRLENDTLTSYYFRILFDGEEQRVKNGKTRIEVQETIQAVSDKDTKYAVYVDGTICWTGSLSGGDTVTKYFSKLPE